jgi:hypothetical protein
MRCCAAICSCSIAALDLVTGHSDLDDNFRMLMDCDVKFAG